jgi:arsenate reductase-like glutaredoxin family protein
MKKLNWQELNAQLRTFSEEDLKNLITNEIQTTRRPSVLKRLHQRYCIVRAARERTDLLALI